MQPRVTATLAITFAVLAVAATLLMLRSGAPAGIVLAIGAIILGIKGYRSEEGIWQSVAGLAAGFGVLGLIVGLVAMGLFFSYIVGAEEQGALVTDTQLEAWVVERDGSDQVRLRVHGLTDGTPESVPFDGWVHYRFIDDGQLAYESNLTLDYDRFWSEPRTYTWHLHGHALYPGQFDIHATIGVDATGRTWDHVVPLTFP